MRKASQSSLSTKSILQSAARACWVEAILRSRRTARKPWSVFPLHSTGGMPSARDPTGCAPAKQAFARLPCTKPSPALPARLPPKGHRPGRHPELPRITKRCGRNPGRGELQGHTGCSTPSWHYAGPARERERNPAAFSLRLFRCFMVLSLMKRAALGFGL